MNDKDQATTILVTGAAGFIGSHLCQKLLKEGRRVIGIDHMDHRPNEELKRDRIGPLLDDYAGFTMLEHDLASDPVDTLFDQYSIDVVVHLAAQTGVRDSLERADQYVQDNLVAFTNVIKAASNHEIQHFLYASSSSVYGANTQQPYSVHQDVSHPLSLYAATKKSNEMIAHSYAHLTQLPVTGLRFFTVYGPWGRPDMAYYRFARRIMRDEPIEVYNKGDMYRDFTYVADIIEAISRLVDQPPEPQYQWNSDEPDPATSKAPYRIYNIGNNEPIQLSEFIAILEDKLGRKAHKVYKPMQPEEVYKTWSDCSDLYDTIDFHPQTPLDEGIEEFVTWFKEYFNWIDRVAE